MLREEALPLGLCGGLLACSRSVGEKAGCDLSPACLGPMGQLEAEVEKDQWWGSRQLGLPSAKA